jgi:hypothetical protein
MRQSAVYDAQQTAVDGRKMVLAATEGSAANALFGGAVVQKRFLPGDLEHPRGFVLSTRRHGVG